MLHLKVQYINKTVALPSRFTGQYCSDISPMDTLYNDVTIKLFNLNPTWRGSVCKTRLNRRLSGSSHRQHSSLTVQQQRQNISNKIPLFSLILPQVHKVCPEHNMKSFNMILQYHQLKICMKFAHTFIFLMKQICRYKRQFICENVSVSVVGNDIV